ncbi:hypothetical protein ACFC1R_15515 [Kitasatospora sp. NPDC056138]|uniref:hypothetical protein n=1 Tax=Kitasatospora sp. NPDC056138 TaxID=3345724 RepID=UPI0035D57395
MSTPDEDTARGEEQVREQSAEEGKIVAPTPADVRAKADDSQDEEEPQPSASDTQAP